jgi:hypothetical protein
MFLLPHITYISHVSSNKSEYRITDIISETRVLNDSKIRVLIESE